MQIDHDRLFKELLTTFFKEFMELFFPEAHALIDYVDLRFLTQEIFTDVTEGKKHYRPGDLRRVGTWSGGSAFRQLERRALYRAFPRARANARGSPEGRYLRRDKAWPRIKRSRNGTRPNGNVV